MDLSAVVYQRPLWSRKRKLSGIGRRKPCLETKAPRSQPPWHLAKPVGHAAVCHRCDWLLGSRSNAATSTSRVLKRAQPNPKMVSRALSISRSRSFMDVDSLVLASLDYNEPRVPNAPKSCIAEIFNADQTDSSPMKNGASRPRIVRDTPTRPRDTHSRLFGQARQTQAVHNSVSPMVTDTIRSHIQFGDSDINGSSPMHSPSKPVPNGSASSTPSRVSYAPPKRNPVTGDGVTVPPQRRRHPAASLREGNPITGDGYKSMNGQINMVTSIGGNSQMINSHSRVPPGGFSSGLW